MLLMIEVTVVVYSKPDCGACRAMYWALDSRSIAYRVVDVTESAAALEYVTQELGYNQAPVVVVDDNDHWSGFRPDRSWPTPHEHCQRGGDDYRAGFLAGYTDRQAEIDTLQDLADRLYRKAYKDDGRIPGDIITRAELEQRRRPNEPPVEVTRAAALAPWGITNETPTEAHELGPAHAADVGRVPPALRANRTGKGRFMVTRTIIGNLATDPEVVQAGRLQITKLRLVGGTGEWRGGKYVPHPDATTHFVEAKFELAENAAATLHKGDAVIVVGREHTASWGPEGSKSYGRVVEADQIGVDLSRAVATARKVGREDGAQ